MHCPCRGPRIVSLRYRAIAKISAACLIVLSVLPFSAPFKTFDFVTHHSDSPAGSLPKDKVDSDDESVGVADESLIPPTLKFVVAAPLTCSSQLDCHPLPSTVLRL